MLHLQTQVKSTLSPAGSEDQVAFLLEIMPERLKGKGRLKLMGIRNVWFQVTYDMTWVRSMGFMDGTPGTKHAGSVHSMMRDNGRPLPDGVYALESVPGFRLTHFSNRWKMQFG